VIGLEKSGLSGRTYTLSITFAVPEEPEAERNYYACADAVNRVLREAPALAARQSRAELTGKKYSPPKRSGTGGSATILILKK
jgi:hypothetical protein